MRLCDTVRAVPPRVVRSSVLVIVLSLFSAPAVGIACGLWCGSGHHGGSAVAHHDMGDGAPAAEVSAAHACDHLFDTVQLFVPPRRQQPSRGPN